MYNAHDKFKLKKVINANGKMTILGASIYASEAIEAQVFGGEHFFEMDELHNNIGRYLEELLHVEALCIVSSASAGISQSVAGVIGQGDAYHMKNPYSKKISARDIIIPKGHNIHYGAPIQTMIEMGGGNVIEAGYSNLCDKDMVEELISDDTAALFYVKSHHCVQKGILSAEQMIELAREHQLPLVVDAAAEGDLKRLVDAGADLVIYSGSKAISGPTSGIVIGKENYVKWVKLQSQGIGRAMKIGKENILGIAEAIEVYLADKADTLDEMSRKADPFILKLNSIPDIVASEIQDDAKRPILRVKLEMNENGNCSLSSLVSELRAGDPAIYTRNYHLNEGYIEIDSRDLNEDEKDEIYSKILEYMSNGCGK
ncbi:MAG: DgaE family pyridoxal phosphate-dependent ammonia lyase [Alkalibacterium sp.]|uniref:DgaE family pyridoxal phosphate-dependent ammonia lyase n=1 Tax=Alkalibacterium sp. TaxID=1872447 RepID=UPI0039706ED8